MQAGMSLQAREAGLELLRREGGSANLFLILAAIHTQMGLWDAGLEYIRQCLELEPHNAQAITLQARLLHRSGRSMQAIEACDAGLKLRPDDIDLLLHKAEAQEQSRQPSAALDTLGRLLSHRPVPAAAACLAARALFALGQHDESVAWARRGAQDPAATPAVSRANWMQIAKVYDALGQYDLAMDAALNAHAVQPGKFDRAEFLTQVDSLVATFAPKNLPGFARGSDKSELPVFLVGMPRSGTTLVEQIITSHPQAYGAGELPDITVIARSLMRLSGSEYVYPDCIDDVNANLAQQLAGGYLDRLRQLNASAMRVTNKAVDQFEHLGLEWLLFPGARVIHVHRDPLDTCLSCFTRYLNPSVLPYVTSLEDLGFVYLHNHNLMSHWKRTLDLPILTVNYEELVANQERTTRQIVEFLGLPWDDRCLRYWQADRTVMTLSYDQVDKPIYDSSIGRWRHYEKHLGPLKAALGLPT
jgi:tetratricopeptide (TPR) repeat protein